MLTSDSIIIIFGTSKYINVFNFSQLKTGNSMNKLSYPILTLSVIHFHKGAACISEDY